MGIEHIPLFKRLEPYFVAAQEESDKSPCVRRRYGAILAYPKDNEILWFEAGHNERVSTCCNGGCARDRVSTRHGGNVEIGGEIHAETSLLINRIRKGNSGYFILVGFDDKGKELYGPNVYPCHSCAMAIKFAGYSHIFIRQSDRSIYTVSLNEIMEHRIAEWETIE